MQKREIKFFLNSPFNDTQYVELLKGLEVSEVLLSKLEKGIRIDSELYQRKFINFFSKIKKIQTTTFEKEALIVKKGIFDIKANCYSTEGIPFVRISNLKNMLIDTSDIVFIPEAENNKNLETFLQKNDIILSKTATPAASLVNLNFCNTSQDTVAIKLKSTSKLLSHFIVTYLNTKSGIDIMKRWFTGNIQMHLNLDDCKNNLLIPVFSMRFQMEIKNFIEKSINLRDQSHTCYQKAESLLSKATGINDLETGNDLANIKTLKESFLNTGRLDAEHYQYKYDKLEQLIKSNSESYKYIKEFRSTNFRGLQPIYSEGGTLPVINSKHILEDHLDYDNLEKTDVKYWEIQDRARVYNNDILTYTTGANIGRTNVYKSTQNALASNHVNILRLQSENPDYVGFVMNSKIGRMQTEKYSAGSAQAELYPKDIDEFLIPFVSLNLQSTIIKNVDESLQLKNESKTLLEVAKKAVEIAVEKNENEAMNYIKDYL